MNGTSASDSSSGYNCVKYERRAMMKYCLVYKMNGTFWSDSSIGYNWVKYERQAMMKYCLV